MPNFVRAANPIWFFVDLVGLPLNDEYYIFFLKNTNPTQFQLVFQDNQGITPWANPLQFYPNGTLPDNIYFAEDEVYRLEIRHGSTQSDPLIYVINNFKPDNASAGGNGSPEQGNQISNPQFIFVDFTIQPSVSAVNKSLTIKTPGTYQLGPDWFLTLTGSGITTVTQVISAGNENTLADPVPPYALKIDNNGWTSAILFQRFDGVAAIWANTFVFMSILARSDNGVANPISLIYKPSSPGTQTIIVSGIPLSTGSFQLIQGVAALPTSDNTSRNDVAYIDMQIVLPPTGIIELSDVQVMGQNSNTIATTLTEPDETIERQLDHQFHYYANSLIIQPKDSLLTGWNFPLNPWQFGTITSTTDPAQIDYITDQTILYQSTVSSVAVGQASFDNNSALEIKAVLGTNIFALIQYIDPTTIVPYWGSILSSLVKAKLISSGTPSVVQFKMRLIYRTTLPPIISATEPIVSFDINKDPVFAAGWTPINPLNDPAYVLGTTLSDFSFNGFQMPVSSAAAMTLGVVLYTISNMSTVTPDKCIFEEISLVPNRFAIESNPLSFDETLRRCMFYYERSWDNATPIGTATGLSEVDYWQFLKFDIDRFKAFASPFDLQYKIIKRQIPAGINLFSPDTGEVNHVAVDFYVNGSLNGSLTDVPVLTNWEIRFSGTKSSQYVPIAAGSLGFSNLGFAATDPAMAIIRYQYAIDSRLGVYP